jgi:hypothetical protein
MLQSISILYVIRWLGNNSKFIATYDAAIIIPEMALLCISKKIFRGSKLLRTLGQ